MYIQHVATCAYNIIRTVCTYVTYVRTFAFMHLPVDCTSQTQYI